MFIERIEQFNQLTNASPSRLHGWATVLATMLIVISVSLVTYRLIEVPARRALRRILTLRMRAPTPLLDIPMQTLVAAE
jgi:peptidoglycan/LPS O-acetylase OafA/YrhL